MSAAPDPAKGPGRPPPRWLLLAFTRFHLFLHRVSGGRISNNVSGLPMCFVEMTGARSGRRLTVPLLYIPHGENVLLVGTQGGAPTDPGWAHNLRKHPDIVITREGQRASVRARAASTEEKQELWPICEAAYPPFVQYRQRTTRDIPIFVCEPAG